MTGSVKHGYAILATMAATWLGFTALMTWTEFAHRGPAFEIAGGAMEGKETRFGVAGGVGSGLYGMLIMSIIAVFIAGLMVGRTPEYLGKKIGVRQIELAVCYLLVTPALVLGLTPAAMALPTPGDSMTNAGPHGFSEILYAYTSAANYNGSAFPRTPPQAPRTAHRPAEDRVGAGVFDPGLPVRYRATASAPRTSPRTPSPPPAPASTRTPPRPKPSSKLTGWRNATTWTPSGWRITQRAGPSASPGSPGSMS